MQIRTTLSADDIRSLVHEVSTDHYDDNLDIENLDTIRTNRQDISTYRFKLGTRDSHASGSRRSWTGRHGRWACWHAFRDMIARILMQDPKAVFITSQARYDGIDGFLSNYPGTADRNVGSLFQPAYMDELCDCPPTIAPYNDNLRVLSAEENS